MKIIQTRKCGTSASGRYATPKIRKKYADSWGGQNAKLCTKYEFLKKSDMCAFQTFLIKVKICLREQGRRGKNVPLIYFDCRKLRARPISFREYWRETFWGMSEDVQEFSLRTLKCLRKISMSKFSKRCMYSIFNVDFRMFLARCNTAVEQ